MLYLPHIAGQERDYLASRKGRDAARGAWFERGYRVPIIECARPFDTCHELSRLYVNTPRFSSAQATRRLDSSRVPSQTQVA